MIPLVGFLPADDERVVGTVAAIERELVEDGLVARYRADEENTGVDGLPPGEATFLPCSFWLVQVYALQGRLDEAETLFERLLGLRNDLGLLSEEYDVEAGRLVGNFPQAFTHSDPRRRGPHARRGLVPACRHGHRRRDAVRRRAGRLAVAVVELRDRDALARFFRERPAVHAYELGDLDDFFWPHTRWLGWMPDGRVEQVALLYDEPDPPVLLAFAEEPAGGMTALLGSLAGELPHAVYAHLSPGLLDALASELVPARDPAPASEARARRSWRARPVRHGGV